MNSDMATPAGRLFYVLGRCMEISNEESLRNVLVYAFDLHESATDAEVMQSVGQLSQQIHLARLAFEKYEEKDEGVQQALRLIEQMFSRQPLTIKWSDVKQRNGLNLFALRSLDRRIRNNNDQEVLVDDTMVRKLRVDLDRFIDEVIVSDIDNDLKRVLVDCLELARQTMLSYELLGVTALVSMRNQIVGFMCMNQDAKALYEEEKKEGRQGVFTKVVGLFTNANTIINFGNNAQAVIEKVSDWPELPS